MKKVKHDFEVGDIVRYGNFTGKGTKEPEAYTYYVGTYGVVVSINNKNTRYRRKNVGVTVHWQTPPCNAPDNSLQYTTEVYYEFLLKEKDFPAEWEKYNRVHELNSQIDISGSIISENI